MATNATKRKRKKVGQSLTLAAASAAVGTAVGRAVGRVEEMVSLARRRMAGGKRTRATKVARKNASKRA